MPGMMNPVTAAAMVLLLYCTAAKADTPVGLWDAGESHIESIHVAHCSVAASSNSTNPSTPRGIRKSTPRIPIRP